MKVSVRFSSNAEALAWLRTHNNPDAAIIDADLADLE